MYWMAVKGFGIHSWWNEQR